MKKTIKREYPIVDTLPPGAMTVKTFADGNNMTVPYVHIKYHRGAANYSIVVFQDVVFVIPKSIEQPLQ